MGVEQLKLNEIINEYDFFHCIDRNGYIFTSIMEPANILDAIVVRKLEKCFASSLKKALSEHSFEEHIKIINQLKIEKAIIIAENIEFIVQCPSLKYLQIVPANSASNAFDYSPLYKMPEIKYLSVVTEYGDLRPCLRIPYVLSEKNRKSYNLKNEELPKEFQLIGIKNC